MTSLHEVKLQVGPYTRDQISVHLEPTGMTYELVPGEFLEVTIRGPGTGIVDIGYAPNAIVIGAWAEAETHVRGRGGEQLDV
jgi:hypothetical protein